MTQDEIPEINGIYGNKVSCIKDINRWRYFPSDDQLDFVTKQVKLNFMNYQEYLS
jgi:hypothetical protein